MPNHWTIYRSGYFAAALGVLLAVHLAAQSPAPFRSETHLVVLSATVRNSRGEMIGDLDRDAFTVFEDDRPQPIEVFAREDVPVSVGLLLDNSSSMLAKRKAVESAAIEFVRASNPSDEVFVVDFADEVRLDVPMTNDIALLARSLPGIASVGSTSMRDAIVMAEQYMAQHARYERRVLVVVTDGDDTASAHSGRDLRRIAEGGGVTIDVIGLLGGARTKTELEARREMNHLADTTGGVAYFPPGIDAVGSVAVDLARQIRTQYTIGYALPSRSRDGAFHRIKVVAAGRDRLDVRTRAGYRIDDRRSAIAW